MKAKDIALILVVVVLVAFTPNSPISVLARDVLADARPAPLAAPVGTAFTYQGELTDDGLPADGVYDFQFKLWDAETSGGQIGSLVTRGDIVVAGGIFAVELDFGAGAFAGEARWLEIGVRPGASPDSYTTLDPRQKVNPTPYALYASNADTLDGQHSSALATSAHNHWGQTWTGSGTGLMLTSSNGTGLSASSTAGSGLTYGVYGTSNSTSGRGVVGWATAGSGSAFGVVGRSDSPAGHGVDGYTTSATGGVGVFGEANATSGGTAGVEGISHATDGGAGVYGIGAASSGNVYGVYGWSQSTGGTGVNGYATAGSGTTYGVQGRSDSPSGWGGSFTSNGNGVYGQSNAPGGSGVHGYAPAGVAVRGISDHSIAGWFASGTGDGLIVDAPASRTIILGRQVPSLTYVFSVKGDGDVAIGGDLTVNGNTNGMLPVPAYDSGWVALTVPSTTVLTHNVGGDPDFYKVDMMCKAGGSYGITNHHIGGDLYWDPAHGWWMYVGAYYKGVTSTTVSVDRWDDDQWCPEVRIRIWQIGH